MVEPKKTERVEQPASGGRERQSAAGRPQKRTHYSAGADGTQQVHAAEAETHESLRPEKDDRGGSGS
jgi:hypothetical protein